MKYLIALCLVGIAWVMFTNKLDEKRFENYVCNGVENYQGDYECVIK